MPVVPTADWEKVVAFTAPYTSVDLNRIPEQLARRGGVLEGLNVVPSSGVTVTVYPGAFLTPDGIAVRITDTVDIAIATGAGLPQYVYAITNDDAEGDVTIDIADEGNLPPNVIILAELTNSGRWFRRYPFGLGELIAQVKGGVISQQSVVKVVGGGATSTNIEAARMEFETEPLNLMVWNMDSTSTSEFGLRLHRGLDTIPGWLEEGREHVQVSFGDFPVASSQPSTTSDQRQELLTNRDIKFQVDFVAALSDFTFQYPTPHIIVPGSNELLVFVEGELQEQSDYTENAMHVSLHTIHPSGTEVALVKIAPVLFREEITTSAGVYEYRLTFNAFRSGSQQLMVFFNGQKLVFGVHYTEEDGETIVLDSTAVAAPTGSDKLIIMGVRSALGGLTSVTAVAPYLIGGGEAGDVVIDLDFARLVSITTPVQADDTVGLIGTADRLARADHKHPLDFELAVAVPLGQTSGGAVGIETKLAREDHQHPLEGSLVTSLNRTLQIPLAEWKVWNIPQSTVILSGGAGVSPAGPIFIGDHPGYLFWGGNSTNNPGDVDSGLRIYFTVPLDYSGNSDIEIQFHYMLDETTGGGDIAIFRYAITADGAAIVTDTTTDFAPPSIAAGVLRRAVGGVDLSPSIFIPGTTVLAGDYLRLDWLRERTSSSDTLEAGVVITDLIVRYDA